MVYKYNGHYVYNKISILQNAPDSMGVYYCGYILANGNLCPLYIGRAKGEGVSIKSRLSDHLRDDHCPDVTHFGYCICTTKKETEDLEAQEIGRCNPKYNEQLKSV